MPMSDVEDAMVDAYNAYKQATGATLDDKTKMLKLPKEQQSKLQPLKFTIGGVDYTLNANAQIFPRSLNEALGGDNDSVYLVVGDVSSCIPLSADAILTFRHV